MRRVGKQRYEVVTIQYFIRAVADDNKVVCKNFSVFKMERDQLTHIALVLEVEKYECLYNTMLPDYARKDITEEAWLEISDTLKLPVTECKDKWRNIRSTFRRSFKPSRNGKSKRSYYLSRYLNFILPYSKPMEDSIFRETENEDSDFMVVLKDVDVDSENSMKEDLELPTSSQPQTSWQDIQMHDNDIGADEKFKLQSEAQSHLSRQAMSSEEDFSIPEHLKRTPEEKDSVIDQSEREHMKYFFLSLLPEFRNMSEKQTRSFKIKVLQLIDDIKNERFSVKSSYRL